MACGQQKNEIIRIAVYRLKDKPSGILFRKNPADKPSGFLSG